MLLKSDVTFRSPSGGLITIDSDTTNPDKVGVDDEWVYWNDLRIESARDLTVDISGDNSINTTSKHITGKRILSFGIESESINPNFDVKIVGLKPGAPYRVLINGKTAYCKGGVTDGKSNEDGELSFYDVEL